MLVRENITIDEDQLTHAVIGLLRYLPKELWFNEFKNLMEENNPKCTPTFKSDGNLKIDLWPQYEVPDKWKDKFWRRQPQRSREKRFKGSIYPDAIISTDKWTIFIESEYSHSVEAEQLFQQFAVAYHNSINPKRDFFVLIINKSLIRPLSCGVNSDDMWKPEACVRSEDRIEDYIAECCNKSLGLDYSTESVEELLLWINWQSLHTLLDQILVNIGNGNSDYCGQMNHMIEMMIKDVKSLLIKENLIPISYDIAEYMADLNINVEFMPAFPMIYPILEELNSYFIDTRTIPDLFIFLTVALDLKGLEIVANSIPCPIRFSMTKYKE